MKNRTFLATLFLFLMAINAVIAALSLSTLRDAANQAKDQCLDSQYLIDSSLYRDMAALEDRGIESGPEMEELTQPYLYLTGNRQASLSIYEGDNLLQSTDRSPRQAWRLPILAAKLDRSPWAGRETGTCAACQALCRNRSNATVYATRRM